MKKIMLLLLIFSLLPLTMAAGDNWKLYFSDGITTINGTDVCVSTGQCLTDASNASGDITAVNTAGPYLTGGAITGAVSLLVDEAVLNATIDSRASVLGDNSSWNETYADTLYADISVTGGNSSFNETHTNTLYYLLTNPFGFYNSTDFSIADYYLNSNPSGFWNDTYATFNKTYADTLYAAAGSGNSSWNETYADTLYIATGEEGNLNVNASTWWAGVSGWVSGWFTQTGNDLDFNETKLNETIDTILLGDYWFFTEENLVYGTADGTLSLTQQFDDYDSISYNFTESTPNGLEYYANTSANISTDVNRICIRYKTTGDNYAVSLWSISSGDWEGYVTLYGDVIFNWLCKEIRDSSDHLVDDKIMMRIIDVGSASTQHKLFIDAMYVSSGYIPRVGNEVDPHSFHINENLNNTGYNITADYFFGNGSQLTGLPTAITYSNNLNFTNGANYWNDTYATFNKTYADTLYAAAGSGNASWNETYANTLYSNDTWVDTYFVRFTELVGQIGNWTLDKVNYLLISDLVSMVGNWTADKGDYSTTTEADLLYAPILYGDDWNKTYADTLYAGIGAGNSSWNESYADTLYADISVVDTDTNLTEDDVEAYIFDDDNTANLNMSTYNITSSGSGVISSNSTCVLIYGATSILEIC